LRRITRSDTSGSEKQTLYEPFRRPLTLARDEVLPGISKTYGAEKWFAVVVIQSPSGQFLDAGFCVGAGRTMRFAMSRARQTSESINNSVDVPTNVLYRRARGSA